MPRMPVPAPPGGWASTCPSQDHSTDARGEQRWRAHRICAAWSQKHTGARKRSKSPTKGLSRARPRSSCRLTIQLYRCPKRCRSGSEHMGEGRKCQLADLSSPASSFPFSRLFKAQKGNLSINANWCSQAALQQELLGGSPGATRWQSPPPKPHSLKAAPAMLQEGG